MKPRAQISLLDPAVQPVLSPLRKGKTRTCPFCQKPVTKDEVGVRWGKVVAWHPKCKDRYIANGGVLKGVKA